LPDNIPQGVTALEGRSIPKDSAKLFKILFFLVEIARALAIFLSRADEYRPV
jgi:hypothetical protein